MSKGLFYRLPTELVKKVYEYDNTYKEKFDLVVKDFCWFNKTHPRYYDNELLGYYNNWYNNTYKEKFDFVLQELVVREHAEDRDLKGDYIKWCIRVDDEDYEIMLDGIHTLNCNGWLANYQFE